MYKRLVAKPFFFAVWCLLMASSGLQSAPIDSASDIFLAAATHHTGVRMPAGFPDSVDFYSLESTPTNVVPESQGHLQGAIFLTLLVGGVLRYVMSIDVRRFFQETFDPLNWNTYQ